MTHDPALPIDQLYANISYSTSDRSLAFMSTTIYCHFFLDTDCMKLIMLMGFLLFSMTDTLALPKDQVWFRVHAREHKFGDAWAFGLLS